MKFTRTNNGLSNSALFYSVDYVVYTEGGEKNFTAEQIEQGQYNQLSPDIKFWNMIFRKYNCVKKLKFKAVGSKSCLRHICEKVESKSVAQTIVALDSDMDDFLTNKYNSIFIIYTKGYSWENDVYHPDLVLDQIKSHVFSQDLSDNDILTFRNIYKNFVRYLPRLLRIELVSRVHGQKLITKYNGERFIKGAANPCLDLNQIKAVMKESRNLLPRPSNTGIIINSKTDFYACTYGKLIEAFSICVMKAFLRKYGQDTFPKSFIQSLMINAYKNYSEDDTYYSSMILRIKSI